MTKATSTWCEMWRDVATSGTPRTQRHPLRVRQALSRRRSGRWGTRRIDELSTRRVYEIPDNRTTVEETRRRTKGNTCSRRGCRNIDGYPDDEDSFVKDETLRRCEETRGRFRGLTPGRGGRWSTTAWWSRGAAREALVGDLTVIRTERNCGTDDRHRARKREAATGRPLRPAVIDRGRITPKKKKLEEEPRMFPHFVEPRQDSLIPHDCLEKLPRRVFSFYGLQTTRKIAVHRRAGLVEQFDRVSYRIQDSATFRGHGIPC